MHLTIPIFVLGLNLVNCAIVRFTSCGNGFTCVRNAAKKVDLTYTCPNGVNDAIFYLNQFSAPGDIESLTIKNCETFTFSTRCSNENKPIKQLKIINIKHLKLQRLQYQSHLPETVIFENISYIETIPSYTFSQVDKNLHTIGCIIPKTDFSSIYFNNVTIGSIQPYAFYAPNNFKNFTFNKVHIKQVQTSAINIKQDKFSTLSVTNSIIHMIEHLGFQFYGKKMTFTNNKFVELSSSAMNGTMDSFYFVSNSVEKVLPNAMSILSTNVYILENNFLYLKSGAFEKISPGLIEESGRNFGRLKFVYDFSKNTISFLDAGSLNPDMTSYENVATEMTFSRNNFYCTCENLGWLLSPIGHGTNTAYLDGFYEIVLDKSFENICKYSCNLPLSSAQKLIRSGSCAPNVSMTSLCEDSLRTTQKATEVTRMSEEAYALNASYFGELKENETFVLSIGEKLTATTFVIVVLNVCLCNVLL